MRNLLTLLTILGLSYWPIANGSPHPKSLQDVSLERHENMFPYRRDRRQPQRQSSRPSISLRTLMQYLESISQVTRTLDSKLSRHEYRETQAADFSSKALTSIRAEQGVTSETISNMKQQIAAVEAKVISIMTLVQHNDERQRMLISKVSEGLDKLLIASLPAFGDAPGSPEVALIDPSKRETEESLQRIDDKLSELSASQGEKIDGLSMKVQLLSESVTDQVTQVMSKQEEILGSVDACNEVPEKTDDSVCQRIEGTITQKLDQIMEMSQQQDDMITDLKEGTQQALGETQTELQALAADIQEEELQFNKTFSTVISELKGFQDVSTQNLNDLQNNLNSLLRENDELIASKVDTLEGSLKEGQTMILGLLEDATSMTDNLQSTVSDNYELLSKEISGLNKVEQVMINTADAVLDTKRSIEFGIQQIILELSDIVSHSGDVINSTLSDQMNTISFNILRNQTAALTNMTQRMEGEISQVWRQIGIMYQQVEQSISMLNNLQDTTDQHMNVSLNKVGSMDGTVGEISGKVAGVEDNLNYLLGRLTLVLSEFNQMKVGVGSELDRLREMASEYSFANSDKDNLKYNINRKRHIPGTEEEVN